MYATLVGHSFVRRLTMEFGRGGIFDEEDAALFSAKLKINNISKGYIRTLRIIRSSIYLGDCLFARTCLWWTLGLMTLRTLRLNPKWLQQIWRL